MTKITRTFWLTHHDDGQAASHWGDHAEAEARDYAKHDSSVIAITGPHEVTFAEGEGL